MRRWAFARLGAGALAVTACAGAPDVGTDSGMRLVVTPAAGPADAPCRATDVATTRLDPPNPAHARYLSEVKNAIDGHWVYPMAAKRAGASGQALVSFAIHPDPSIRGIKVLHSTGIERLDPAAINAIRLAAALLPEPGRSGRAASPSRRDSTMHSMTGRWSRWPRRRWSFRARGAIWLRPQSRSTA